MNMLLCINILIFQQWFSPFVGKIHYLFSYLYSLHFIDIVWRYCLFFLLEDKMVYRNFLHELIRYFFALHISPSTVLNNSLVGHARQFKKLSGL